MAAARRVLVLGGGVIGVTTAYFLARHGCRVALIDRQSGAGLETSFANGGLVTPSMADPWAAPGLPLKMLKWIGREDSPFLLRPSAIPGLMSWGLQFLRNCREETWRRNTATILRIADYSQRVLKDLTAETGLAYDLQSLGTLRLFRDELSMQAALRTAEVVGRLGVRYRRLDAAACAELEPALAPQAEQITGGIHFPDDECGDAHLFTRGLAARCAEMGVTFHFEETVEGIETDGARVAAVVTDRGRRDADHVVLALGTASPALARPLGVRLPIYPVKGYSVTLSTAGWNGAPRVPIVDDGRKMGIVRLGDRLRLAGTAEFTGHDTRLSERRCANLTDNLRELFPSFANWETAQPWTGLRPMTPDGIPILGPTPLENFWLNVGHGHLGWTMSCGSAKAVADLIAGAPTDIDLAGMTLGRA